MIRVRGMEMTESMIAYDIKFQQVRATQLVFSWNTGYYGVHVHSGAGIMIAGLAVANDLG